MKIKFEFVHKDSGSLRTKCPHGRGNNGSIFGYIATRVGSDSCKICPFCKSRDIENQVVYCDHRPPLKTPVFLGGNGTYSNPITHITRTTIDPRYIYLGYSKESSRRYFDVKSIFNLKSWGNRGWQVAL